MKIGKIDKLVNWRGGYFLSIGKDKIKISWKINFLWFFEKILFKNFSPVENWWNRQKLAWQLANHQYSAGWLTFRQFARFLYTETWREAAPELLHGRHLRSCAAHRRLEGPAYRAGCSWWNSWRVDWLFRLSQCKMTRFCDVLWAGSGLLKKRTLQCWFQRLLRMGQARRSGKWKIEGILNCLLDSESWKIWKFQKLKFQEKFQFQIFFMSFENFRISDSKNFHSLQNPRNNENSEFQGFEKSENSEILKRIQKTKIFSFRQFHNFQTFSKLKKFRKNSKFQNFSISRIWKISDFFEFGNLIKFSKFQDFQSLQNSRIPEFLKILNFSEAQNF